MRTLTLALALALASMLMASPAQAAKGSKPEAFMPRDPAILRESVVVSGKLIRLGDLFMNAGDKANIAVAYSPAPGKRATFGARWLYRAARHHGLPWRPMSLKDKSVVERNSITIRRQEIERVILEALIDKGADENMQVQLHNRLLRLHINGDAAPTIGVEDVVYDPSSRRFTAILVAPADDPAAPRTRVTGRLNKMVDVPVMAQRMLGGDIITRDHLKWIKMRADRVQNNAILDGAALIGKSARRGLRAGAPIRTSDVRRPVMVPKGSLVTIIFKMPFMTLTARGRALQEGSKGDTVRIANARSKTVVEAVVIGTGRVSVAIHNRLAMN
jgi:flagellar basal body P-ring formation protein FlgA